MTASPAAKDGAPVLRAPPDGGARVLIAAAGAESDVLGALVAELGHSVCAAASSLSEAVAAAEAEHPDVVLLDCSLAAPPGAAPAATENGAGFAAPVLLLAGPDDGPPPPPECAGAVYGHVEKPANRWRLRRGIADARAARARERALEQEHRAAAARVERRATILQTVFDSMSLAALAADVDQERFLVVNPAARGFVADPENIRSPGDWYARHECFPPGESTPYQWDEQPLTRAARGESVDDFEMVVRDRSTGDTRRISTIARPLISADGTLLGGLVLWWDVTAARKAQADLRRATAELREQARFRATVLDTITDGVLVADREGNYVFVNAAARPYIPPELDDASPAERVARYGIFLPDRETPFPPDDLPLVRALRGEPSDDVEMFARNAQAPEGGFLHVSGRPLLDEDGAPNGGVVVFRDVTRLKRAEAELRRNAEELERQSHTLETVFHSISDGVVVADENGRFTIFNPSAERLVGMGAVDTGQEKWSEAYGIFFPDRVTPVPPEELPLSRAIGGESCDEVELFIRNPMIPEGIFLSVNGRPLRDERGLVRGGVAVFRDVTERMQAEQALTEAFAEGRIEILDTVLHNIGNAINSVATGVGAIREELSRNEPLRRLEGVARAVEEHREDLARYLESDPQGRKVIPFVLALAEEFANQAEWLTKTMQRVDQRVGHIVDIIRTQRSGEGGSQAAKDIALSGAITDAVRILKESLDKRGYPVGIDCRGAPREIRVHETRFQQMLVNLVKNAMEALDALRSAGGQKAKPRIRVRVRTEAQHLVLDVTDNGIGFEPKRARHLFMAGYSTKEGGTGLGLHSTANFAVASGGNVEATSGGPGQGATIRVRLPLSRVLPRSGDVEISGGGGGRGMASIQWRNDGAGGSG